MQAPVVLLRGPAGCGKTAAALALYRDFIDSSCRPRCLLLAPNSAAVGYLRRRLLDESPNGVVVAPNVLTFAGLAERVLAAAGSPSRSASSLRLQLLLRQIVDELAAAGKLESLQAVADTPGVVPALERAIGELKRAAFDAPDLRKALGRKPGRAADLLEVYERYQLELQRLNLHDTEGQAWLARDELRRAMDAGEPWAALQGAEALAVDGFTDFTPTQLEMLALISRRLGRVLITLCWDEDGRGRMWHWTGRTLRNLREALGESMEEIALGNAGIPARGSDNAAIPGCGGGLAPVWDNVFHLDQPQIPAPPGLHTIAACGRDAEVDAVAGRVKRLLLGGARPGSIAVLARSLEEYDPAFRRIFERHAIPVAPAPAVLAEVGVVRFLLDVAGLAPRYGFRSVLRVLKSSYLRPGVLGDFDEQTVATAEMIVREGNVLEGYSAYAEAAERLAGRARRQVEEDDEPFQLGPIQCDEASIRKAGELLAKLLDLGRQVLAEPEVAAGETPAETAAPAPKSPTEGLPWALKSEAPGALRPQALVDLVDILALRQTVCEHEDDLLVARDLRAIDALVHAASELATWCGDHPPTLERLEEALARVPCPPARTESLVDVLDVLDARALRSEHVFLLGLGEGKFPRKMTEASLVGEAERQAWSARGARLDSRSDLAAREMLLFYLALSRANRELTLSYLEAEDSGAAGAAGPFLLAAVEPLGGLEACDLLRIPMGQFLPNHQLPTSRSQAVLAAVAGLFQPGQTPHAEAALAWAGRNAGAELLRSARGLWARHRRWRAQEMDAFDGRLDDPALLAEMRGRFAGAETFSASALNSFGQCPWQYFATYLLNLRPLSQPQRKLEAVTRGTFIHNVLQGVMSHLRAQAGGEFDLAALEEGQVLAALEVAFQQASDDVELRRPPFPVLWRIQRQQMHGELKDYLLRIRGREGLSNRPMHFELAFGLDRPTGPRDVASRAEPVEIQTPAGPLRLRGKIDRVDRVRFGGREGLLVIDYKTGGLASPPDVLEGRSLQLPLYAEAARQLLGCDCLGGVFHRVGRSKKLQEHYFARMRFIRGRYAEVDDYEDLLSKVLARVGEFLQAMREGRFDVMPTADCPSYCPFRQICHYSPARDEVKRPPKTEGEEGATAPKSDPLTESKPRPEVQPPADRSGKQKKKVDNRDKGGAKR